MANASGSNSGDLYVGAGKWYAYRWLNGVPMRDQLVMIGDVGSATISTDITSIEHRSSMDQAREVMASINTEITQKLVLELFEYNPGNVAFGLYGSQGVLEQQEADIIDEIHTVKVDSNIRLMDALGNVYRNVTGVTIKPATPIAAVIGTPVMQTSGTSNGDLTVGAGPYTGTTSQDLYIMITQANTTADNVTGIQFMWGFGSSAAAAINGPVTVTAAAGSTTTSTPNTLANGVDVTFDFTSISTSNPNTGYFQANEIYRIPCTAAVTQWEDGVDFVAQEVDIRDGVINIPPNTHIPDNSQVLVTYHVPEGKYPKVMGGTVGKIEVGLVFIGDPNLGPCYNGEFWKVAVKPNGDLNLIGTEFGSFQLECTLLSDRLNHPKEPLYSLVKVKSN